MWENGNVGIDFGWGKAVEGIIKGEIAHWEKETMGRKMSIRKIEVSNIEK